MDPACQRIAVGSNDFLVSLWDLEDLSCYQTVSGLDAPVRMLSYSGDGKYIAAALEGSQIHIVRTKIRIYFLICVRVCLSVF